MAQARPYYADRSLSAAFYDVVTAADERLVGDVDIYASLAAPGASVLELGAGAGRVAFELARRGYRVTGVDIAPAMLSRAEARRAELPPELAERVEFRRADMTAFDLKRTFDLAICTFFTLAHVPAGTAWRNTFHNVARSLEPGGLAAFHLPLLDIMRMPGPPKEMVVFDKPLPAGGRLQLHVLERSFKESVGRLDQVIEYVERDARGAVVRRSPERLTYYVTDPEPLAAGAGLVKDREPIPLGGVGEIWVFRKA